MGKRVIIALAVAAIALVGVFVWPAWQQREPVYQGKPLSEWLKSYGTKPQEADAAVRQAGTNALPTLLRLLRVRDSDLKIKLMDLAERQHIIKIEYAPAEIWNWAAVEGLRILGTNAQSAVPALIEIANQNISRTSRAYAIDALGYIGPPAKEAVASILQGATNADWLVRFCAIQALGEIHADADRVVPMLINALHDPTHRAEHFLSEPMPLWHLDSLDRRPNLRCPRWSNFSAHHRMARAGLMLRMPSKPSPPKPPPEPA